MSWKDSARSHTHTIPLSPEQNNLIPEVRSPARGLPVVQVQGWVQPGDSNRPSWGLNSEADAYKKWNGKKGQTTK